ncbi:MAG: ResB protein required for cytochrome c biosynthesis-like [Geobacteraceae bacterium]|nr:MAG: ResB protein required for cytochrome c biosynthesis-like [Geobacteraceae bacterium]
MPDIRNFITARRLSLSLILVLAGMMCVSTLIPQEMDSTPDRIDAWRRGHEQLRWLVDGLGLHRIYVQPWFAVTILLAATALAVSSCDQLAAARRRLYSTASGGGEELAASIPESALRSIARSHRYRSLHTGSRHLKFVRNPWGYFGNALLHIGMVLVVCASLYVALTGRQGALVLFEGEQHGNRQVWDGDEHGVMASPLTLPGPIRLDRVRVRFDGKNQPTEVSSDITIGDGSGKAEYLTATINRISRYHGLRIYHASQNGDAFVLEFTDAKGDTHYEKIAVQQPVSLTKAGYGDFYLKWSPHVLSAKYFADADNKSMSSAKPLLVMRLLDREEEIARVSLTPGNSGMLGDNRVRLLGVQKWAKLIFVDITGMPVIFAGFAIIMLGGLIHYMTPPRELIGIRQQDDHYRVYWKAPSFRDFFAEERQEVANALQKEVA